MQHSDRYPFCGCRFKKFLTKPYGPYPVSGPNEQGWTAKEILADGDRIGPRVVRCPNHKEKK